MIIDIAFSDDFALETSFQQRSGCGPVPHIRNTKNLEDIIRNLMLPFHLFDDDTQLLQSFGPMPKSRLRANR